MQVNGEDFPLEKLPQKNLLALLQYLKLSPDRVAVEINSRVIPKEEYATTPLHEEDRVEILHFVGGGI